MALHYDIFSYMESNGLFNSLKDYVDVANAIDVPVRRSVVYTHYWRSVWVPYPSNRHWVKWANNDLDDIRIVFDLEFGITDVSALNLDICTGITDVSPIINNHTLNLDICTGITDVSALDLDISPISSNYP